MIAPLAPGAGVLAVERGARGSVVTRAASLAPLRLLTPKNHGDAVWAFQSSLGGGLVDGDGVALDVAVGDGASLLLATQASTKVYRSPKGCTQRVRARVGDDGLLVVLPDPVVCYAGARLEQSLDVELGARASLVIVDAMTSGRAARGERWAFARYRSAITITCAPAHLVLRDVVELDPAHGALAARMHGWDALATVIAVGPRAPALTGARTSDWLAAVGEVAGGTLLRGAARSADALHRGLRAALSGLPALLGDDPFARKY